MRKIAYILSIIGIIMILLGIVQIIKQNKCDKLTPNEFFKNNYCVKNINK